MSTTDPAPPIPDPATEPLGGAALARFVHPSATGASTATVPPVDTLMAPPADTFPTREELAANIRADREATPPRPVVEPRQQPAVAFICGPGMPGRVEPAGLLDATEDGQVIPPESFTDAAAQEQQRRALDTHAEMVQPTVQLERASIAAPRPELDWTRDWQGRPRILPDPAWEPSKVEEWQAGRANDQGEVPYTRVTTYAEALQDSSALTRWKMRRVVLGAGRRPDYVTAAAALSAEERDKDSLDDLAEKMLEAAGPNAADVGTALHSFTERIDRGEDVGEVPPMYRAGLEQYRRVVGHLTFVERECRTVCDQLEVAGTPDGVAFCDVPDPDGVVDLLRIVDTKTGRVDYSAGKFSTQLAIYGRSHLYHPGTGARTSYAERHGAEVSTRWGIVVHMPAGAGTAELLWLSLEHGWDGALEAGRVREWRTGASGDKLLRPVFARAPRPATTDGTCRGRQQDGKACSYRAKKVDGVLTPWCGRHQRQQADLDRYLAENPGADPAAGEETLPDTEPVQPSTPPVRELVEGTGGAVSVDLDPDSGQVVNIVTDERRGELAEAGELDGDDSYPDHGPADDAAAAYGAPSLTVGMADYPPGSVAAAADDDQWAHVQATRPARELNLAAGTYALDPATEQNGNRRPQSGLSFPEQVAEAARAAEESLLARIAGAQSDLELAGIWQSAGPAWTARCAQWASARQRQLADERARARPEAALLAAIATTQSAQSLVLLHQQYGGGGLWTPDVDAAAAARWRELS